MDKSAIPKASGYVLARLLQRKITTPPERKAFLFHSGAALKTQMNGGRQLFPFFGKRCPRQPL